MVLQHWCVLLTACVIPSSTHPTSATEVNRCIQKLLHSRLSVFAPKKLFKKLTRKRSITLRKSVWKAITSLAVKYRLWNSGIVANLIETPLGLPVAVFVFWGRYISVFFRGDTSPVSPVVFLPRLFMFRNNAESFQSTICYWACVYRSDILYNGCNEYTEVPGSEPMREIVIVVWWRIG